MKFNPAEVAEIHPLDKHDLAVIFPRQVLKRIFLKPGISALKLKHMGLVPRYHASLGEH